MKKADAKNILVTGGAGFIGSNFIRYCLKKYKDVKIINLDKLTYAGNIDNLSDIENNPNYCFVKGDITDEKLVKNIVKDADIIFNFAAETHVDRSIKKAADFVKTNVFGTFVLLEAAKQLQTGLYVQVSTDEVYGSILKGRFTENSLLNPSSPYSASKAAGDLLALSYYKTHNLPVIITRSSNNFGPYQYPEKVIPLFITNALENKKLPLYGDGLNVRDWIYVADNCRAIDLAARKGMPGQIYNIGAGNELNNLSLTDIILKQMKKPKSLIEHVKDRLAHDRRYALNCAKIRKLGWSPEFNFKSALCETIEWYINNQIWWKKLKKY